MRVGSPTLAVLASRYGKTWSALLGRSPGDASRTCLPGELVQSPGHGQAVPRVPHAVLPVGFAMPGVSLTPPGCPRGSTG